MRKPWPRAWKNTAQQDRVNDDGQVVTIVMLRNASGVEVQAESGDFVRLRKKGQMVGVIDRITPSRVRVLVGDKIGNYLEENLIFHKKGGRSDIGAQEGEGHKRGMERTSIPQNQSPEVSIVKKEETPQEPESTNEEVLAFFKEMEAKMRQYTKAAVELYVIMEKAKAKFTQGPARYREHTEMIQEEFMSEAMRRVNDLQQFIDKMEEKLNTVR